MFNSYLTPEGLRRKGIKLTFTQAILLSNEVDAGDFAKSLEFSLDIQVQFERGQPCQLSGACQCDLHVLKKYTKNPRSQYVHFFPVRNIKLGVIVNNNPRKHWHSNVLSRINRWPVNVFLDAGLWDVSIIPKIIKLVWIFSRYKHRSHLNFAIWIIGTTLFVFSNKG